MTSGVGWLTGSLVRVRKGCLCVFVSIATNIFLLTELYVRHICE